MKEGWAGWSPECCSESAPTAATGIWGEGCRTAGRRGSCGAPRTDRTGRSPDWQTTAGKPATPD